MFNHIEARSGEKRRFRRTTELQIGVKRRLQGSFMRADEQKVQEKRSKNER